MAINHIKMVTVPIEILQIASLSLWLGEKKRRQINEKWVESEVVWLKWRRVEKGRNEWQLWKCVWFKWKEKKVITLMNHKFAPALFQTYYKCCYQFKTP